MLSRVAENIYWLGRYTERAENTARIVSVNTNLLLDLPRGVAPGWAPLIAITGYQDAFEARYASYDERNIVRFLMVDPDSPCSVISSLISARENARTIRDIIPREAWEVLTELYNETAAAAPSAQSKRGREGYLRNVVRGVHALTGLLDGSMNRGQGYQFLNLGRMLERADMTTRIIDVRSSSLLPEDDDSDLRPYEGVQWRSVLRSLNGYQSYRQRVNSRIRRRNVLGFLLHDEQFPRSVAMCIAVLSGHLATLPRNRVSRNALVRLRRILKGMDVGLLATDNALLHAFTDELQMELATLHDAVARTWFPSPQA